MATVCAFNPPLWVGDIGVEKKIYREWAMRKMIELEMLNQDEIQAQAFEFWKHLIFCSKYERDPLWVRIDNAFLEYFHMKDELLFKEKVFNVKKSHKDKYTLSVKTRYGCIHENFSSIRECKDTTGLELRNQLRKILYK